VSLAAVNAIAHPTILGNLQLRIKLIACLSDADTATCRGAAQYGITRRPLVSLVIAPKSYIMRARLPAESEVIALEISD
jgi:hypothetical protein